jgi:hypothetical protein
MTNVNKMQEQMDNVIRETDVLKKNQKRNTGDHKHHNKI